MSTLNKFRKGDRVYRCFTNGNPADDKIFWGTVRNDEIEDWWLVDVDWDDNKFASMFPTPAVQLFRPDADKVDPSRL